MNIDATLIGTSVTLTLSADSTKVQQDTPSQTVSFVLNVIANPCFTTFIEFTSALADMSNTVTQTAVTQTFTLATDSASLATATP